MVEVGHKVQMGLQLLSHRVNGTGRERRELGAQWRRWLKSAVSNFIGALSRGELAPSFRRRRHTDTLP